MFTSHMGSRQQTIDEERIHGDRRFDRRYHIPMELRWKLVRRRKVLESGSGTTVDLSSGGILFDAGRPLPVGMNVELAIVWPVLLHDVAPMQLVVGGRIVRTHGSRTAIQMIQHEFRTAGLAPAHRAGGSSSARHGYFSKGDVAGEFETVQ